MGKKITLLHLFVFAIITEAYAQLANKSTLNTIANSINKIYRKPIDKKLVLFSIWVSTDKNSKVDSVYFSEMSPPLTIDMVLDTAEIKTFFKRSSKLEKKFSNTLFIIPILYRPLNNIAAIYLPDLGRDFSNLIPEQAKFRNKKLIVEKPTEITIHETVN
ncbi:hypothetical protein [Pedobacter endophyticus]|uniref:Uncharacterized protein n=1 Tax=Pedobacter endophyticus TaxID=2789740 RepID=A0A7U3SQU5_9SPHI|nr:hypothetical protein [Pedobacter endophyticus]QPH38726.1 hypothetical protein IZT61_16865 [Pedobacter endophyticus]